MTVVFKLTNKGMEMRAKLLIGTSVDPFTKLQLGTDSTTATASDTNLIAPDASTLATATVSNPTAGTSQWLKQWQFTTEATYYEIAIKNTAGDMLARGVSSVGIGVGEGDTLQATIQSVEQEGT